MGGDGGGHPHLLALGADGGGLTPVYAVLRGQPQFVLLTFLLAGLIFVRHHANIRRLLAGTEPRIGKKTEG